MNRPNPEILDDYPLLELMLSDSKQRSALYKPGPYWLKMSQNAANEIRRCGLSDFRGSSSLIGRAYSDNVYLDYRDALNTGVRKILRFATKKLFPLNKLYDAQVQLTRDYAQRTLVLAQEVLRDSPRVSTLLAKYSLPYSLAGGCISFVEIDGHRLSISYLNLLDQHDRVAAQVEFGRATTVFEIGGGFGINVNLLIENYESIRKVLYLDIPPNLYVGTQYLKAFYGKSVYDYSQTRGFENISFSGNDQLEILCIAPWQIERIETAVDIFCNARSFVEMPEDVVENYASRLMKLPNSKDMAIVLTSYAEFDPMTTFDPDRLPLFFTPRHFQKTLHPTLLNRSRKNIYLVSPGKFKVDSEFRIGS